MSRDKDTIGSITLLGNQGTTYRDKFVISSPPISTLPLVGVSMPDIIFMVVLFPAPFGPMNPTISPSSM